MGDMERIASALLVAACFLVLVVFLSLKFAEVRELRREAVKRGFAEYRCTDDGDATWTWKDDGGAK